MTHARHTATRRPTRSAALAFVVFAASLAAAQAQVPGSVEDYHLPAAPTPRPTGAGPVDSDHPVAAPTTPAPAIPAAPAPRPVIVLPTPAATPGTAHSRRAERPAPAPTPPAPETRPAAATPAPETAPVPSPEPVLSPSPPAAAPAAPVVAATASPAPASAAARWHWTWLAGGSIVLLLLGMALRRRNRRADAPEPAPQPDAAPEPRPLATLTPPDPAPPAPAITAGPLAMELEARHLSRALVNATLAYRLTLTNAADSAIGPLRIGGDIVSAHASLSAQEQLAPGAALATIHEVASLAPGESIALKGELRLPLASILPIQRGASRVFVPLARFRAEAPGTALTRVFVIGRASEQPGGALRPFPLDRGPGVDRALGQRELEVPA
jgi:hypothetical protein